MKGSKTLLIVAGLAAAAGIVYYISRNKNNVAVKTSSLPSGASPAMATGDPLAAGSNNAPVVAASPAPSSSTAAIVQQTQPAPIVQQTAPVVAAPITQSPVIQQPVIQPVQSKLEGKLIRVNSGAKPVYYVQNNQLHYVAHLPSPDGRFNWGMQLEVGPADVAGLTEGIPYEQMISNSGPVPITSVTTASTSTYIKPTSTTKYVAGLGNTPFTGYYYFI
jgi:hypothetical protein